MWRWDKVRTTQYLHHISQPRFYNIRTLSYYTHEQSTRDGSELWKWQWHHRVERPRKPYATWFIGAHRPVYWSKNFFWTLISRVLLRQLTWRKSVNQRVPPLPNFEILKNIFFQHNLRASGLKYRVVESMHHEHSYFNKEGGATPQKNIFRNFKFWQRGDPLVHSFSPG